MINRKSTVAQIQPSKKMNYDFCIYIPGEPDYWGQFDNREELFDYLSLAVPGFVPHEHLRPEESTEFRANYRVGKTLVVVTGL